jgi:hypothetical protein
MFVFTASFKASSWKGSPACTSMKKRLLNHWGCISCCRETNTSSRLRGNGPDILADLHHTCRTLLPDLEQNRFLSLLKPLTLRAFSSQPHWSLLLAARGGWFAGSNSHLVPETTTAAGSIPHVLEVPLDHFGGGETRTFPLRFYTDDTYV